jgi:hypothetical protein
MLLSAKVRQKIDCILQFLENDTMLCYAYKERYTRWNAPLQVVSLQHLPPVAKTCTPFLGTPSFQLPSFCLAIAFLPLKYVFIINDGN